MDAFYCIKQSYWIRAGQFLIQNCGWETASQHVPSVSLQTPDSFIRCPQIFMIIHLFRCSSSITLKADPGFNVSCGTPDSLHEIPRQKLYKRPCSDEKLSPFESLFLPLFVIWALLTGHTVIHRLRIKSVAWTRLLSELYEEGY